MVIQSNKSENTIDLFVIRDSEMGERRLSLANGQDTGAGWLVTQLAKKNRRFLIES